MGNTKPKITLDVSDLPYQFFLIIEVSLYVTGTMVAGLFVEFDGLLLDLIGLPEDLVEVTFDAGGELSHHHPLHGLAYTTTKLLHHFVL